jgi:signal peptidase I
MVQCIGVKGPSMLPAIDERDNLLLLDTFTTKIRSPRRNEIIMAENPFKAQSTIVKRVLFLEGEIAEFYD